jgi:hypothetical protein
MANFIKVKDLILNDFRNVNLDQIVSITENNSSYEIRMANADCYKIDLKENKKLIQGVLNENIQLPSERVAKGTNRSIQRPAK